MTDTTISEPLLRVHPRREFHPGYPPKIQATSCGICLRCGTSNRDLGDGLCVECFDQLSRTAHRYWHRKSQGLCVHCDQPPLTPHVYCLRHLERQRLYRSNRERRRRAR